MANKLSLMQLHMQYFLFLGFINVSWLCLISKNDTMGQQCVNQKQGICSCIGVNYFCCPVYIQLATKVCDGQWTQSILTFFNRLSNLNYHKVIKMWVAAFRTLQLTRFLISTTYCLLQFQLNMSKLTFFPHNLLL